MAKTNQEQNASNRYEVIDGLLYVSPTPDFFHQWIVRSIVRIIFLQLDDLGLGITVWSPLGVFMPLCDPVQPDIVVLRPSDKTLIRRRGIFGIPSLLIEVVSPNNAIVDSSIKRKVYARAGVPEYWVVRPQSRDVFVCWQPESVLADYAQTGLIGHQTKLLSPTLPLQLQVADFFADAPENTFLEPDELA